MKKAWMIVLLVPLTALAAPPREKSQDPGRMDPARMEQREKRTRLMRLVGLAETLDLNTQDALRLDEVMRQFDDRRRPLKQQVAESAQLLRRAADGDSAAIGQVDQAIQRILDARGQLANLDRDMFNALSKDLKPQQRAKMALYFARFERQHRGMHPMRMKMRAEGPAGERESWGQLGDPDTDDNG